VIPASRPFAAGHRSLTTSHDVRRPAWLALLELETAILAGSRLGEQYLATYGRLSGLARDSETKGNV
jgi:hypothetical protein